MFFSKKVNLTWLRETISCMMKIITMAWVDNLRELLYVEMQLTMHPSLFWISTPVLESLYSVRGCHCRFLAGKIATAADTLPTCCCYCHHILFRKIQAGSQSCQSYLLWRPCIPCTQKKVPDWFMELVYKDYFMNNTKKKY